MKSTHRIPNSAGIGLRLAHFAEVVATRPSTGWLEVHPENVLANPHAEELLAELSELYPISLLLPLPYNGETLRLVTAHLHEVQDALGRPYLVENPSSYVGFRSSMLSETEFLSEIVRRAGCQLLCDVSNVVVSAHNMGYDAYQYIDDFPADAIREVHLGGYTPEEDDATPGAELLIDTHAAAIAERSWDLYAYALRRFGAKPTLIEWDNAIPPLTTLLGEALHANEIAQGIAKGVGEPANAQ